MFLYANLSCDQENLEKGLFKGSLLVKVSLFTVNIYIFLRWCADVLQAYKSLFTSPSSVTEGAGRNDEPPPTKRSKNSTATRSHVASLIGLSTVTPRSIAYVAVQVTVLLTKSAISTDY